jgi:dUTP pyrophosphatase
MPVIEEPTLLVDTTNGKLPKRATFNAAGLDLFANKTLSIPAHSRSLVRLEIKVALPMGTYGQIAPRSGLTVKGIDISAGVIDFDYRRELQVVVINHADQPFSVYTGDRIAQLIVKNIAFPKPVKTLNLDQTFRGIGGFGSTGIAGIDLGLRDAISRHMSEDNFGKGIHRALDNKSVPFPGRMVAEDWTANGKLLLVAVVPYFLPFSVFFSPALVATAPHTWLSHGRHVEATQSSCSAHSASFASRITGYLVTQPFWTLIHAHHLSHQSHVTRRSVHSVFCINTGPCRFS